MALLHDSDRAWKTFGETEAYYAVCSNEEFRGENLTEESRRQFFQSGEEHVDSLLEIVRQQLVAGFQPRVALDFGCGVGRLVIPFAASCERVVGVDVSPAMLNEAKRNCEERGVKNVEFYESLAQLRPADAKFDLVHTFIVLQHIPVRRGMSIVNELIDRVDDGGIGVVHVTYRREAPRVRKIVNWFRRRVPLLHNVLNVFQGFPSARPLMQMNNYSIDEICHVLQRKNCHNVVLRFTNHGNNLGVVFLFKKEPRSDFR